jgi:hypothetical protein
VAVLRREPGSGRKRTLAMGPGAPGPQAPSHSQWQGASSYYPARDRPRRRTPAPTSGASWLGSGLGATAAPGRARRLPSLRLGGTHLAGSEYARPGCRGGADSDRQYSSAGGTGSFIPIR